MTNKLNIKNSRNMFNLALIDREEFNDYTLVDETNLEKIKSELMELEEEDDLLNPRNETVYKFKEGTTPNDLELLELLFKRGRGMIYQSTIHRELPQHILVMLGKFRHTSYVEINLDSLIEDEDAMNIDKIAAVTRVVLTVDEDVWDTYDLINELSRVRYIIDKVIFHTDTKDAFTQYDYFDAVRDALSGWKMYINFVYNSPEEYGIMASKAQADENARKGRRVW